MEMFFPTLDGYLLYYRTVNKQVPITVGLRSKDDDIAWLIEENKEKELQVRVLVGLQAR